MFNELNLNEKILNDQSYAVIGACMAVHRELGTGFLEAVYQEALVVEFGLRDIPFVREKKLSVFYKGEVLDKGYFADFICFDEIIIELKALSTLDSAHEAQLINYLRATNQKLGLLINFGQPSLQQKRVLNKNYKH